MNRIELPVIGLPSSGTQPVSRTTTEEQEAEKDLLFEQLASIRNDTPLIIYNLDTASEAEVTFTRGSEGEVQTYYYAVLALTEPQEDDTNRYWNTPRGRCFLGDISYQKTNTESDLVHKVPVGHALLLKSDYGNFDGNTIKCSTKFSVGGRVSALGHDFGNTHLVSYRSLFEGNATLVRVASDLLVDLDALVNLCFEYMFKDCTSLEKAPDLPNMRPDAGTYASMFEGCTSLRNAPKLPARNISLEEFAYYDMFKGCSSLQYVCALFDAPADAELFFDAGDVEVESLSEPKQQGTLGSWLTGLPEKGVFVKSTRNHLSREQMGIPAGWQIVTEDDDPGGYWDGDSGGSDIE